MAWIEYNPNPRRNRVGDCAIRAIAKATDQDWEMAYTGLYVKGYSMGDGYLEAQGSYAGEPMNDGYSNARRGEHWVRGHYSRDGNRMYNRDSRYSYRRRDSRGRYSRADGKDGMMESMKEIMADATTEKEREIIRDAMSKLEKA